MQDVEMIFRAVCVLFIVLMSACTVGIILWCKMDAIDNRQVRAIELLNKQSASMKMKPGTRTA